MLISSILTHNAIENYNKERYGPTGDHAYSVLIGSLAMFVIEISMLYFALRIAFASGENNNAKFIHVVLAIFLTLPYLLLNMLFNKSATSNVEGFSLGGRTLKMGFDSCGM